MNTLTRTLILPFVGLFEALTPFRIRKETTKIVPEASISGRALFIVITIMSFLASLTAGSVYMINEAADSWFNDIASEVTVQVNLVGNTHAEQRIKKVSQFLRRQPGIVDVTPLTLKDSADLLEPWLGTSAALKELPIPRLIAVQIDRKNPANLKQLSRRLSKEFVKVTLDDHRHWQNQIRKMTRALAIIGFSILFFVGLATFAIVLSASRAAMGANKDIIEVLHFVGAKQHFIAHEFEKHFLILGIRAGLLGATLAALAFFFLPSFMEIIGGQSGASGDYQQLFGTVSLNTQGYLSLIAVVVTVASICMLTSRYWVDRILRQEGTVANPVSPAHAGKNAQRKTNKLGSIPKQRSSDKGSIFSFLLRYLGYGIATMLLLFMTGFILFVFALDKHPKKRTASVDGIVAYTGGRQRIHEAVNLLSSGKAKRLLISGVEAKTRKRQIMQLIPASVPLFNCCIDLDRKALNTIGNAREARRWAETHRFKSLMLVTSNYHMPRALLLTRKAMPKTKIIAYPVMPTSFKNGSWWYSPTSLSVLFSEYAKYIATLIKSKIA